MGCYFKDPHHKLYKLVAMFAAKVTSQRCLGIREDNLTIYPPPSPSFLLSLPVISRSSLELCLRRPGVVEEPQRSDYRKRETHKERKREHWNLSPLEWEYSMKLVRSKALVQSTQTVRIKATAPYPYSSCYRDLTYCILGWRIINKRAQRELPVVLYVLIFLHTYVALDKSVSQMPQR